MQRLGAIPGRGVAKPVYVNIPSHRLPLLDKTKPRPEPPVPEKRPRGRPRKHPLPVKPPKPYVPKPPKQPEVPDAPTCSNCGCAKEETSKAALEQAVREIEAGQPGPSRVKSE